MKFNLKTSMAGILVLSSFLPVLAFAEDTGGTSMSAGATVSTESKIKRPATDFCARLSNVTAKLADQIKNAETKRGDNETKRADTIAKKQSDTDANRAQSRTNADSKRLTNWDKMTTKAKTDAQKAAVAAYKATIQGLVTDRRTAVDTAVKTYRDGLTSAMTSHSGAIDTAIATFKASVDTALAKAQADCTAGVASKTVKTNFNASIADARKILKQAKTDAEMASGLTALRKTRNDAITLAETTFKTATAKARADLVLALKS